MIQEPAVVLRPEFTTFTSSKSVGNGTEVLIQKLLRFFVFWCDLQLFFWNLKISNFLWRKNTAYYNLNINLYPDWGTPPYPNFGDFISLHNMVKLQQNFQSFYCVVPFYWTSISVSKTPVSFCWPIFVYIWLHFNIDRRCIPPGDRTQTSAMHVWIVRKEIWQIMKNYKFQIRIFASF